VNVSAGSATTSSTDTAGLAIITGAFVAAIGNTAYTTPDVMLLELHTTKYVAVPAVFTVIGSVNLEVTVIVLVPTTGLLVPICFSVVPVKDVNPAVEGDTLLAASAVFISLNDRVSPVTNTYASPYVPNILNNAEPRLVFNNALIFMYILLEYICVYSYGHRIATIYICSIDKALRTRGRSTDCQE
jgi:hypothetical protein